MTTTVSLFADFTLPKNASKLAFFSNKEENRFAIERLEDIYQYTKQIIGTIQEYTKSPVAA